MYRVGEMMGSLTKIYNTSMFICENIKRTDVFTRISKVNDDPVAGAGDQDPSHTIAGTPCAGHAIVGNWVAAKAIAGQPAPRAESCSI
jgi:hypothetical protein